MKNDKCITPEYAYCPCCEYGCVIIADFVETREDLTLPGAVQWYCELIGKFV